MGSLSPSSSPGETIYCWSGEKTKDKGPDDKLSFITWSFNQHNMSSFIKTSLSRFSEKHFLKVKHYDTGLGSYVELPSVGTPEENISVSILREHNPVSLLLQDRIMSSDLTWWRLFSPEYTALL